VYGIVVEALVWLAALARAAIELLHREIRAAAADTRDVPPIHFGDPGYPDEPE
jgi:hypothetical protein